MQMQVQAQPLRGQIRMSVMYICTRTQTASVAESRKAKHLIFFFSVFYFLFPISFLRDGR